MLSRISLAFLNGPLSRISKSGPFSSMMVSRSLMDCALCSTVRRESLSIGTSRDMSCSIVSISLSGFPCTVRGAVFTGGRSGLPSGSCVVGFGGVDVKRLA